MVLGRSLCFRCIELRVHGETLEVWDICAFRPLETLAIYKRFPPRIRWILKIRPGPLYVPYTLGALGVLTWNTQRGRVKHFNKLETFQIRVYISIYLSIYLSVYLCVYTYIYIYICIYIYGERERERERESVCVCRFIR